MMFYLIVALSCLFAVYVNTEITNCVKQADILFIVDASGSIGDENFEKVRNFLADFSRQYQVGKNLTHFSEIIFSSPPNINIVFGFNKYLTNTELSEALLRTPYPSGETYTAQALNLARTSAFTSANGARDGVPKIAVVLTDGKSTYPNDTSREAEDLKKSGAVVLAIGVSQKISPEELNTIATLPSYVFHVEDFAGLQSIINNVSKTVCTVVEQKAESTCVSLYRCLGKRDGDYPACAPECQEGYYYSCVNGYAYQRPCALGKYVDSNNELYTALMVYDPATNKCQLTSSYCPRKNPKPYVAPNPPTAAPKSRPTECIQFNCKNKEDNDYPACFPECQQGYFYSCVNEFAYKRECALGWFIDTNNKPYTARLIYDPAKGSCEYDVPSCPRDKNDVIIIQPNRTQQTTTESCVRDKSCEGYKDGFYPPCDAGCCNAKYYECSNHKTMELECNFGWFLDANNQRYTEKLIYDPIKNTCEYSAPSCSRGQIPAPELPATTTTTPQPTTTTEGPCVVEDNCEQFNDGVFPPCGAGCNNIHYYECRNYKAYYRTCNVGQVYSSSQKKCVPQTGAC